MSGLHKFGKERASKYDSKIRLLSPGYETLHELSDVLLKNALPEDAHVLVVVAGTGMDILTCGANQPDWRFTAVEPSAEMLEICRENIFRAKLDERVEFFGGYVEELPINDLFDAATSIYVSHFIREDEKNNYFSAINSRLKQNAPFVVADMYGERGSDEFKMIYEDWKSYYLSESGDLREAEKSFEYILRDIHFIAENRLAKVLEQSGFDNFRRFFQSFFFGGWVCRKSQ